MIRLYRQIALQLLMTLMYLKDARLEFKGIHKYVSDHWQNRGIEGHSNEAVDLIRNTLDHDYAFGFLGESLPYDDILDQLVVQLSEKTDDADLIDTVVRVLKLPYAQNYFESKTITALRKAILLPDELVKLNNKLKEQELHCGNCHREIHNGEMVSFARSPDRNGVVTVSFYCANCHFPEYVACTDCKENVTELSIGVKKGLKKRTQCPQCIANKENGVEAVPVVGDVPQAVNAAPRPAGPGEMVWPMFNVRWDVPVAAAPPTPAPRNVARANFDALGEDIRRFEQLINEDPNI